MLKQLSVKTLKSSGASVKQMYDEANKYLENIGFKKISLVSVTSVDGVLRSYVYFQGNEKIILEYSQDRIEETVKLMFTPMEIQFIYDILLMRFNQLAKDKEKSIFIYED